jgi:hypothetical protein
MVAPGVNAQKVSALPFCKHSSQTVLLSNPPVRQPTTAISTCDRIKAWPTDGSPLRPRWRLSSPNLCDQICAFQPKLVCEHAMGPMKISRAPSRGAVTNQRLPWRRSSRSTATVLVLLDLGHLRCKIMIDFPVRGLLSIVYFPDLNSWASSETYD